MNITERNKFIRIADNSAGGWATVREYESSGYADNEEDGKCIRQAENRSLRSIKDRKVRAELSAIRMNLLRSVMFILPLLIW
jgi:hypothetical protein